MAAEPESPLRRSKRNKASEQEDVDIPLVYTGEPEPVSILEQESSHDAEESLAVQNQCGGDFPTQGDTTIQAVDEDFPIQVVPAISDTFEDNVIPIDPALMQSELGEPSATPDLPVSHTACYSQGFLLTLILASLYIKHGGVI
jgi:hypothetical protein